MTGGRAAFATTFSVFVVAYFLSFFYRVSNAVLADDLIRDVGLGPQSLGIMTSMFFIAFAGAQLPLGAALDRFGARWVTSGLLVVASIGSWVFATSTTPTGLGVGRALLGLGLAGVLMGAFKLFASTLDTGSFVVASGLIVGLGSLGALAAATPLTLLSEAFGWRNVFLGAGLVTLGTAGVLAILVRDSPGPAPGSVPSVRGLIDIFSSDAFWRIAGLGFSKGGTLMAFQGLWAGPYLSQRLGASALDVGNVLLIMGISACAGFVTAGSCATWLGLRRALAYGAMLLAAGLTLLLIVDPTWPLWVPTLALVLLALGASTNVLTYSLAREYFPSMPGRAVTAVNLFTIGGAAIMQAGLGMVIGWFPLAPGGAAPPNAFAAAIIVALVVVVVTLFRFLPLMHEAAPPERDCAVRRS
jgi:predicted MFS family arabinose efflux permease